MIVVNPTPFSVWMRHDGGLRQWTLPPNGEIELDEKTALALQNNYGWAGIVAVGPNDSRPHKILAALRRSRDHKWEMGPKRWAAHVDSRRASGADYYDAELAKKEFGATRLEEECAKLDVIIAAFERALGGVADAQVVQIDPERVCSVCEAVLGSKIEREVHESLNHRGSVSGKPKVEGSPRPDRGVSP